MEHNAAPPPAQSFQTATRAPLRAELIGSRRCSAVGITATGNAPVLTLCRRLIEAGHDPAARLEAYRGTTLCLRVRSIGELFLSSDRSNSAADTNARDAVIAFSIAVQHGADPEAIRRALSRDSRGRASGPLGAALDRLSAEKSYS